jgi:hypothetical protein
MLKYGDVILLEFGTIRENLDVYHGLENISQTGKVLYITNVSNRVKHSGCFICS